MVQNVVRLANKLIIGKIVEIAILTSLIGISIPIWSSFKEQISLANITTLKDYKMDFKINKNDSTDYIIIDNPYNIDKSFKVFLEVDKKVNPKKTVLIVNDEEYILDDFSYEEQNSTKKYTLIASNIAASFESYSIKLKISGKNKEYQYIFKENNNF